MTRKDKIRTRTRARQDKTRQDKREDKTKQNTTQQNETKQRQDKTRQPQDIPPTSLAGLISSPPSLKLIRLGEVLSFRPMGGR